MLLSIIQRNTRPPTQTYFLGNRVREQRGGDSVNLREYLAGSALPQDIYLNCNLSEPQTVLFPPNPGDGARISIIDYGPSFATNNLTLVGNGNRINDEEQVVLSDDFQNISFMYRRDLADWLQVVNLGLTSQSPYPAEFDDLFVIELALRINPRYGSQIDSLTAEIYREIKARFMSRYQKRPSAASPDKIFRTDLHGFRSPDLGV